MSEQKEFFLEENNKNTENIEMFKKPKKGNIEMANALLNIKSKEEYEEILEYGAKIFFKLRNGMFPTIHSDQEFVKNLVMEALVKTALTFNPNKGAAFKTHFYDKVKGEMTIWMSKASTTQTFGKKMLEKNNAKIVIDEEKGTQETISMNSIEDDLLAEESYRRKMTAQKMAKAELPMLTQKILYGILEYENIKQAAQVFNMTRAEITEIRDNGLSLLLKKVLRSPHLNEEEIEEIREIHKEQQLMAAIKKEKAKTI